MATNYIQQGKSMYLVTTSGAESGDPFVIGNYLPCVLITDADSTDSHKAVVQTVGVFNLSAKGDVNNIAVGDMLYWLNKDTALDKTAAGKKAFGIALEATTHASNAIKVLLTPEATSVPKYGVISQAVTVSDFTDGGGTSGYVDLTPTIPKGAIPLGWKAVVTGAFDGDTTAVIQVGITGDTDRFSADTVGSVFAAGVTVGSMAIAADACKGINAAVTVRVTVTGDSDFTAIATEDNGAMTVSVYYIQTD